MPEEYLKHILQEVEFLLLKSRELSFDDFVKDEVKTRAFLRSLEIMGEATKKIPENFRTSHQNVDWRAMAGMRDRLIHDYFGVDYEIVWDVVINEIPKLKSQLEELLK